MIKMLSLMFTLTLMLRNDATDSLKKLNFISNVYETFKYSLLKKTPTSGYFYMIKHTNFLVSNP